MAEKLKKRTGLGRWLALAIAGCVLLPIVSIAWMGFGSDGARWAHLLATVFPRYLSNSLSLMLGVGAVSLVLGTSLA